MTIEIVDFPIKNGGSFHSFLYVYQRVTHWQSHVDTRTTHWFSRYGRATGSHWEPGTFWGPDMLTYNMVLAAAAQAGRFIDQKTR